MKKKTSSIRWKNHKFGVKMRTYIRVLSILKKRTVEIGSGVEAGQRLKIRGCFEHRFIHTLPSLNRLVEYNDFIQAVVG